MVEPGAVTRRAEVKSHLLHSPTLSDSLPPPSGGPPGPTEQDHINPAAPGPAACFRGPKPVKGKDLPPSPHPPPLFI